MGVIVLLSLWLASFHETIRIEARIVALEKVDESIHHARSGIG